MNRVLTYALVGSLAFMPSSCSADVDGYTAEAGAVIKRTAYVKFTPVMPLDLELPGIEGDLELEPRVIGSAWATKVDGDYRIVTAQHVMLATVGKPGRFEVCSHQDNCLELDRLQGVGPVLGDGPTSDWLYWEVDRLPTGLKASKLHDPTIGEPVCIGGAPLGRTGEVTCGAVTNVFGSFVVSDARIMPGNSGGPVFDSRNRVLGMVIAMDHPEEQGLAPVTESALCLVPGRLWF